MKKQYKIILAAAVISATSFLAVSASASSQEDTLMRRWGSILSELYYSQQQEASQAALPQDEEIFEKGNQAVITADELNQAAEYYQLGGMSEKEALSEAADYTREREALYQQALKNGYDVTDQEVWDYLEQFKKETDEYSNGSIVDTMMNQFDSEEDFWNYEFTVYKKNLPIQNYVHDLEEAYRNGEADSEKSWETYFAEFKEKLAEDENYQKVQ